MCSCEKALPRRGVCGVQHRLHIDFNFHILSHSRNRQRDIFSRRLSDQQIHPAFFNGRETLTGHL